MDGLLKPRTYFGAVWTQKETTNTNFHQRCIKQRIKGCEKHLYQLNVWHSMWCKTKAFACSLVPASRAITMSLQIIVSLKLVRNIIYLSNELFSHEKGLLLKIQHAVGCNRTRKLAPELFSKR